MTNDKTKKEKSIAMNKKLLIITAVLCAVSVVGMILALTVGTPTEGGFSPPPFDPAAQAGAPTIPQNAGYGEMDAKAFRFSAAGALTAESDAVDVWLTNSTDNSVWLKVRILDKSGRTLGESGLIRPGEYVQSVRLDRIPKENTEISLKIMAYEPDTYYSAGSAVLNTVLKVA